MQLHLECMGKKKSQELVELVTAWTSSSHIHQVCGAHKHATCSAEVGVLGSISGVGRERCDILVAFLISFAVPTCLQRLTFLIDALTEGVKVQSAVNTNCPEHTDIQTSLKAEQFCLQQLKPFCKYLIYN